MLNVVMYMFIWGFKMKRNIILILPVLLMVGCTGIKSWHQEARTPYGVNNLLIAGHHSETDRKNLYMLNIQQQLYIDAYKAALKIEGIILDDENLNNDQNLNKEILTNLKLLQKLPDNNKLNESKINKDEIYQKLFLSGTHYTQLMCTQYLNNLDYAQSNRSYTSQQVDIIGGTIAAALGLFSVPSAIVGGTSLGFSSFNSSLKAYENSYMLSPEIEQVEKLVREKMIETKLKYHNDKKEWKNINNLYETLSALEEYSYHCSQTGIKSLIKNAMEEKINFTIQENAKTDGQKSFEQAAKAQMEQLNTIWSGYHIISTNIPKIKAKMILLPTTVLPTNSQAADVSNIKNNIAEIKQLVADAQQSIKSLQMLQNSNIVIPELITKFMTTNSTAFNDIDGKIETAEKLIKEFEEKPNPTENKTKTGEDQTQSDE